VQHPRLANEWLELTSREDPLRILSVVGARPNFMKVAPIHEVLLARGLDSRILHTGQHYDRLTLRENTERPITIEMGTNELLPLDSEVVLRRISVV
jgi:UDP-N-acetylglucosamine 2-epimerase